MREATDQDLLRRYCQDGDEAAFTRLGERYERLVYATCLRELGHPEVAADAAQETFLLLAREARKLSRPRQGSLAGWLFVAARNTARNARRAEGRRKAREEAAGMEWEKAREQEARALWGRLEPRLNEALAHLRPGDREALLLRFFEQRSHGEIGQSLGIGENAAQMRVSRALERLRERLRKLGIVASVGLLATLLERHAVSAAVPPDLSRRIALTARQGRAALPPPPRSGLVGLPAPHFVAATLIGVGLAVGVAWWKRPALPERSRVDVARLNGLAQVVGGSWEGTVTGNDGTVTPVRLHVKQSPDKQRLTFRYDYPPPRDAEVGWWTVEERTGRLVAEGRDVFRLRQDGSTLFLEGWERGNTGMEVQWRFSRQRWEGRGKRLRVTFDAGTPPKRQRVLLLRKR